MVRISRGTADDASSFQNVKVEGHGYDSSTGKFKCGDKDASLETVKVQLPYDTSCPDCVLQWIYDAPGFGKIYQCIDISVLDKANREDCINKCKNGGICENKKCYCTEGFKGEFCEINIEAEQEAKKTELANKQSNNGKKSSAQPVNFAEESNSKSGGIGFFGWYFILLLISLIIIGIIFALAWFLCKERAQRLVKGEDKYDEDKDKNKGGSNKSEQQRKQDQDKKKKEDEERKKNDKIEGTLYPLKLITAHFYTLS